MPNLDKALGDIATKLGTKAEILWPQLVAIQKWEWWTELGFIILLLLVGLSILLYAYKKYKIEGFDSDSTVVSTVIASIVLAITVGLLFYVAFEFPTKVLYPEIGAAKYVLRGDK